MKSKNADNKLGLLVSIQKRFRRYQKKLHQKISLIWGYLKFHFRYQSIRIINRSIYWSKTHIATFGAMSLLYFIVIIATAIFAGRIINISVLSPQAQTYFITVGAMVGGIIAIIFSFKTLIMQNAADNSSAGFYRTLGKDSKQDVVLFILVFTVIAFFVLGLTAPTGQITILNFQYDLLRAIFQFIIVVIGADLYLVFLLYHMLFKKIDPFYAISQIQKSSLHYLSDVYMRASQFADLMLLHPKTDKKTTKDEMLASTFQSFHFDFQYLSNRLNYLFDYHDKMLAKNERTASFSILDVITSILEKYFIIRKDSSLLLPSGYFFVSSSDSQAFLTPHLESLVAVGEGYLKREDSVGVRKIISLFQDLIGYAGEIKFVGTRSHDNPILMQCRGYLGQLMDSIIQKGFFEGMYQGVLTYKAVGAYITRKLKIDEIMPIYDTLDKIFFAALTRKQDVVVSEVINTYSFLLIVLAEDYWLFEHKLKLILEHIQQLVLLGFFSHKTRSIPDNRMQQDLAKPYEALANFIILTSQKVASLKDGKKKEAKSAIILAAEELRSSLRYLSENLKNADHLLIQSLADVNEKIGGLLISLTDNPDWADEKSELIKQAGWYIHQPKWFTNEVNQIDDNLSYDALPDAVAKMGLVAVQKDQEDLANETTKVITQFATEMLEKEAGTRFGFTEPRIMVLACYVGIYALKQKKTGIVNGLKGHIKVFEDAYRKKWFSDIPKGVKLSSPTPDQLQDEVIELIDNIQDLNRMPSPFNDAKEILLGVVAEADVRNFIKTIWGVEVGKRTKTSMFPI